MKRILLVLATVFSLGVFNASADNDKIIAKEALPADAQAFIAYLQARIDLKIENSKAYPTMDTSMLKSAKFVEKDGYVWYCAVKGANDGINSSLESKFN